MHIRFLHGPDREPFAVADDGRLAQADAMPFHGIASRGLRTWLESQDDGVALWERCAHRLDDDLGEDDLRLQALQAAAGERGVLTFAQSAHAARAYVEHHCAQEGVADGTVCELWNTKEGHT